VILTQSLSEQFLEYLRKGDAPAVQRLAAEQGCGDWPLGRFVDEVLAPLQVAAGFRWEQGQWSVADEHRATATWQWILDDVAGLDGQDADLVGLRALVTTAEGEWHLLPAQLAARRLQAAGMAVEWLGGPLPGPALHSWLAENPVEVVIVNCSMGSHLAGAARSVAAAQVAGAAVVVGGRAVTEQRAVALGADGGGCRGDRLVPVVHEVVLGAPGEGGWLPRPFPASTRSSDGMRTATQFPLQSPALGVVEEARPTALGAARQALGGGQPIARWWFEDLVDAVASALVVRDIAVVTEHLQWLVPALGAEGVAVECAYRAAVAVVEVLAGVLGPAGEELCGALDGVMQ